MLSSRSKYATRALVELSLRFEQGHVSIHEIAERQNIPVKFLEQILLALKMLGLVHSKKGPGGGYELARSPQEITLGQVVRALDGPIAPISCVSVYGYQECGCPDPDTCGLKQVFKQARDALADVLDTTTFADVAGKQFELADIAAHGGP
ncbi:MAG: Rrf2 family transcriptional regulator [Fimbriimonas ginsengisoli]|uniref:Rrf2 family transcriptional regulator n=1 Tax=Fimbriimonas ginsengisoli TaxID=1005039 RepID=A0A931LX51_FIMGI|nr:Rrf2 family transcriptional regulator [Fimbriimonas ginsengisoli]